MSYLISWASIDTLSYKFFKMSISLFKVSKSGAFVTISPQSLQFSVVVLMTVIVTN